MKNRSGESSFYMAWWVQLVIVGLISMLLITSNWPTIRDSTLEVGDFAANSLLIQDAKSFHLYVGNYSRVGFNHPGPAILYVLAAGEVLFYDILRIVDYPVSGQLIAVAIYNACWLFAILRLMTRLTGSRACGVLATALFACAAAWCDAMFFTGMWFPHLYFLPFATMLLAASRLATRYTDSWLALAVSTGFLINGHVSFVAIVGIIFLIVIARSHLQSLRDTQSPSLISKLFLTVNRTRVVYFLGTISLFFVPLIIDTLLRFPGPIAEYIRFGGGHKPNSIDGTLIFTSYYWGGVLPMFTGFALLGVLSMCLRFEEHDFASNATSLLTVFFSATFALWFYARYGVDLLDHKYIGLFYFAVPALTIALAVTYFYRQLAMPLKAILLNLLVLLCVVGTYKKIAQPASYAMQYNQPQVAELYRSLSALEHRGRLVLDLDNSSDWRKVWSNTLGLLAFAKRQHNDIICINQNWHISFSRATICTSAEVASGKRIMVQTTADDAKTQEAPLFRGGGLSFYVRTPPQLIGLGYVSVEARPKWFSGYFLQAGWSAVEQDFVWSQERKAQLVIPVDAGFNGSLILDLGAYLPTPISQQHVTVAINGVLQPQIQFTAAKNRQRVLFSVAASDNAAVSVDLNIEKPISPSDFGSGDMRKLGVSIYGLQVERR